MSKRTMVDDLEARRLFASSPLGDGPVDGSRVTTFELNGSAFMSVGGGLIRTGQFALPKIGADGSADIKGSDEADVLTAERVVGVDEEPNTKYGAPGDGELDFVNLIAEDGTRILFFGPFDADGVERQRRLNEATIQSAREVIPQWEAEGNAANISSSKQALAEALKKAELYKVMAAKLKNGDFIHYRLEGVYDYYAEVPTNPSSSAKLTVNSGAGNDNVSISQNVPMKTVINGGSGGDKLTSGKRNTSLYGGGGNDILISRSVKGGTLDGGKGSDRYVNRAAATGDAGEVHVMARNDGDRVIVATGAVPVIRAGTFGTSEIDKHSYYLMDTSGGQIDLLA